MIEFQLIFFQTDSNHRSLWNCLFRVFSFNIVLGHIPGKTNSAVDLILQMHTDSTLSLYLGFTDYVPIPENQMELKQKHQIFPCQT